MHLPKPWRNWTPPSVTNVNRQNTADHVRHWNHTTRITDQLSAVDASSATDSINSGGQNAPHLGKVVPYASQKIITQFVVNQILRTDGTGSRHVTSDISTTAATNHMKIFLPSIIVQKNDCVHNREYYRIYREPAAVNITGPTSCGNGVVYSGDSEQCNY